MLYGIGGVFLVLGFVLGDEPPLPVVFVAAGVVMFLLAASFHHLTVEDQGDRLAIRFGPLSLFRRSVRYDGIVRVERGRTTNLDGWGIHLGLRGGWVWNIWGRDCVVVHLRRGKLYIGTDDAENLAQ